MKKKHAVRSKSKLRMEVEASPDTQSKAAKVLIGIE
jgi:hypothetical protein